MPSNDVQHAGKKEEKPDIAQLSEQSKQEDERSIDHSAYTQSRYEYQHHSISSRDDDHDTLLGGISSELLAEYCEIAHPKQADHSGDTKRKGWIDSIQPAADNRAGDDDRVPDEVV